MAPGNQHAQTVQDGQETPHKEAQKEVMWSSYDTSKNLIVRTTMFPYLNIHKFTSPDGKTRNQIDHILTDRSWHSSVLDVQSFRGADCDIDHNLVVAKLGRYLQ
jgi:hypothetical protein